jgi:diguanylate cyclase (GGDEF)-like protein
LKPHSVGRRAAVYIVFVCALLAGIEGWWSWSARSAELGEMEVATSNLAQAVAQHASDTFKEADTVLLGVVERVGYDGVAPAALNRLNRVMTHTLAELPQLNTLSVFDANGERIATSHAASSIAVNNAGREYFIYHRTHPGQAPHISVPVISRTTGKWVIPLTRRIERPDGSFGGVAVATISVDFFKAYYDSLQIGRDGAIALVLDSGTMLLRQPYISSFIGADMRGTALLSAYAAQGPAGSLFIKSSRDGVTRLHSYRHIGRYPLLATAALSKDEILAQWRKDTLLHAGGVAILVALAALLGWRLVQQINLRSRTEAELLKARDELVEVNRKLEQLAMFDPLTGLANRRQFDAALASEFGRARRQGGALALVMLDVDFFKQYNDIYGHAAGDECLRQVGRAIRGAGTKRATDLVVRYGGEEIAVLLPDTDLAGAVAVAERIRSAIVTLNIAHRGNPAGIVTVSAGVDAFDVVSESDAPKALIEAADRALYEAKNSGRNRVCGGEYLEAA